MKSLIPLALAAFIFPWLILDQDYQYVLVGSRSPEYLWILSRQPSISDEVRDAMLAEAVRLGYDTSKLIWVDQSANLDKE